jgi:hypothetical protein
VRLLSVVVPPPPVVQDLGFAQCSEDLGVQQFIPELAVEDFIETVSLGAPRCDAEAFDPNFRHLFSHGPVNSPRHAASRRMLAFAFRPMDSHIGRTQRPV